MQNVNSQRRAFLDMLAWSEGTDNGRQPWWRRIIEAGMCAIFAFYIKDGLSLAGLDPSWASLGSVFIGFLGVDFIRQIADKRAGIQRQE
ncbi:hypothetical protein EVK84_14865 [Edwardsiella piscicida]|nr:hypothetical protein EVK84_14865 [Edwardsiella piscicida]